MPAGFCLYGHEQLKIKAKAAADAAAAVASTADESANDSEAAPLIPTEKKASQKVVEVIVAEGAPQDEATTVQSFNVSR